MKSRWNSLLFLTGTLLLSGCAVTVKSLGTRMESPEAMGIDSENKIGLHFDLAVQGRPEAVLTPDMTLYAPNTSYPAMRGATDLMLGAGISFVDRLDLSVRLGSNEVIGKYQLLGDTRTTSKQGNVSVSILGAILGTNESKTAGSSTYSVKNSITGFDLGILVGYRADDIVLLYGGGYTSSLGYAGTYTPPTPPSSEFSGNLSGKSIVLGTEIGTRTIHGRLEAAWVATQAGSHSQYQWFGGASLGVGL